MADQDDRWNSPSSERARAGSCSCDVPPSSLPSESVFDLIIRMSGYALRKPLRVFPDSRLIRLRSIPPAIFISRARSHRMTKIQTRYSHCCRGFGWYGWRLKTVNGVIQNPISWYWLTLRATCRFVLCCSPSSLMILLIVLPGLSHRLEVARPLPPHRAAVSCGIRRCIQDRKENTVAYRLSPTC